MDSNEQWAATDQVPVPVPVCQSVTLMRKEAHALCMITFMHTCTNAYGAGGPKLGSRQWFPVSLFNVRGQLSAQS